MVYLVFILTYWEVGNIFLKWRHSSS